MDRIEMPPNASIYYTKVIALVKLGQLDKAKLHLLDMMRHTQSGALVRNKESHLPESYVAQLAMAYAERGDVDTVKELFKASRTYQLPLLAHITDALLVACLHPADTEATVVRDRLEDALAYIEQCQSPLFVTAYIRLINHYTDKRDLAGVELWYKRGVEAGYGDNLILLTSTVNGYSHAGASKQALALYKQMRQQPDFRMHAAIVAVLCDLAGFHLNLKYLRRFWRDAKQDGTVLEENSYAAFAEAAWRLGEYQLAAEALMDWMPKAGHKPNLLILYTLYRSIRNLPDQQALNKRILQVLRDVYQLRPGDRNVAKKLAAFAADVAALKASQSNPID